MLQRLPVRLFGRATHRFRRLQRTATHSCRMCADKVTVTVTARKVATEEQDMPEAELDLRLQRLLFFADGVYAIAVTLLAVELVLPEAAADLHGGALLDSLLDAWSRVLAFLTSFVCIAFLPFPTSVIGEHVSHPVAQQFYFGSLLLTGLVMWALW